METKLFYNEESISTVFDVDETNRWKELVESLSLTGQKELLVNDKLVMPFPLMTEAEGFISKSDFSAIPFKIHLIVSLNLPTSNFFLYLMQNIK